MRLRRFLLMGGLAAGLMCSAVLAVPPTPASAASPALPADFDGDGNADLAIGMPAFLGDRPFAGMVGVVYGAGDLLTPSHRQRITQDLSWVPGGAASEEGFGGSLASADFNADGYADLAVCTPMETEPGFRFVGSLTVLFGSAVGLNRGVRVVANCHEVGAGDFDKDGYPDLAILGWEQAYVMYGRAGFAAPVLHPFGPTGPDLNGRRVLAVGDVTGDGYDDVLFTVRLINQSTRLLLYRGGPDGIDTTLFQKISTETTEAAATGDIDGDGYADVAIGNPRSTVSGRTEAGRVRVWFGSSTGLDVRRGPTGLSQDTAGIPAVAEEDDLFGLSVALGDVDGDGKADLAVGVPYEDVGTREDAGLVTVVRGSSAGLDLTQVQEITQDTGGVPDSAEAQDLFGSPVAFRDFNRNREAELIVSADNEDAGRGSVTILTGTSQGVGGPGLFSVLRPQSIGIPTDDLVFFGRALG
jgi:hypothetical protein